MADRERDLINVEEWAEIKRLHLAEGMGVKAIVRKMGIARNTVRAALRSDDAPRYEREGPGSAVDAFEPEIRRLLSVTPDMPATVIGERIGWTLGITVLRERVAELRPAYQVPEAFGRTEYKPGELGQWDLWFPDYAIPVGHGQTEVLPVLVGVPCYTRWILARMIGSKESADVLGGHLALLVELGRVPRVGVYSAHVSSGPYCKSRARDKAMPDDCRQLNLPNCTGRAAERLSDRNISGIRGT